LALAPSLPITMPKPSLLRIVQFFTVAAFFRYTPEVAFSIIQYVNEVVPAASLPTHKPPPSEASKPQKTPSVWVVKTIESVAVPFAISAPELA